jgi:hypothetical protein
MAADEEIEIETNASSGVVHRTIIWIVVEADRVFIRSVNGETSRWYREATADPSVAIHVQERRLPVRLLPATDPASVAACSDGLRRKYRPDRSLQSMLEEHTLATTLEVVPA